MSAALLRSGALVAAGLALSASASAQTVDLLEIIAFREEVASSPYLFEVNLEGSGINSVTVEALSGGRGPIPLQLDQPGVFFVDQRFTSANDLRGAWPTGDYRVNVNDGALVLDVSHQPQEPLSRTQLLTPRPFDMCIPLPMQITWADVSRFGATGVYVEMEDLTLGAHATDLLPDTATTWDPPPGFLQHGHMYELAVNVVNVDAWTTLPGGTEYISGWAHPHEVVLQTSFLAVETPRNGAFPNPDVFLPGFTTPPLLGQIWDPFISHTNFAPNAVIDILAFSLQPGIDVPSPFGSLLILPPDPGQMFMTAPGSPFAFPIPPDCRLAGLELMTQAASFTPRQGIELTNGLDVVLGSQ